MEQEIPFMMTIIPSYFASIDREAVAVAIVCVIFLALFVVAGVRDIIKRRGDE